MYLRSLFKPRYTSNFCIPRSFFYSSISVFGKGKPTEDPFVTPVTPNNLGEDSYFIVESKKQLSFGVADGVGGWTESKDGAPELISRGFMKHCEDITNDYINRNITITPSISTQIIFSQAYERLQSNPPGLGSTTATVLNITPYEEDYLINCHFLGDSGFMILRQDEQNNNSVILAPAFQKIGECPFQLACNITPDMEKQGYMNSKPGEGVPGCIKTKKNDIILLASDGLWDNLTNGEIMDISNSIDFESKDYTMEVLHKIVKQIMNNWKKFDDLTMICVKI